MFRKQNRGTATAQTYLLLTLWRGGPGTSTTVSAPVLLFALYPLLCIARLRFRRRFYSSMGCKQYSRMLGLSRG